MLVARRQAALEAVAARCQGRGHVNVADVSKRADVRRVVGGSNARFGRLDVWIDNVGQGIAHVPSELTDDDLDGIMQVNVKSALSRDAGGSPALQRARRGTYGRWCPGCSGGFRMR